MSHGSLWVDSINRCGAAVPPDKSGRSAPTGLVSGSQVTERSAGTGLVVKGVVLVFASMLLILAPRAFAQDEPILAIAVGNPGSPSYKFGLGLMSLFQSAALPDGTKMGIEIWYSLSPSERIAVLLEEVQLAVIRAGEAEREDWRARHQIRAAVGLPDGNQVLVRADLSDDLVYNITRLVFEHSDLMRSAYPEVGDLEPSASLMRIQGGAHPGALRYYEEQRELQQPPALRPPATVPVGSSRSSLLIFHAFNRQAGLEASKVLPQRHDLYARDWSAACPGRTRPWSAPPRGDQNKWPGSSTPYLRLPSGSYPTAHLFRTHVAHQFEHVCKHMCKAKRRRTAQVFPPL